MDIQSLTQEYKEKQDITIRQFAEQFSDCLPEPLPFQIIGRWLKGAPVADTYIYDLAYAKITYPPDDWRGQFARQAWDILMPRANLVEKEQGNGA